MQKLLVLVFLAGCAHREAVSYETPLRPDSPVLQPSGPAEMSKRQRFACAMSDGSVYRDAYGEHCIHVGAQASLTPQSTTTNCYRIGDSVHCTTN